MALADEITITFDGERITLRPTLRAAMRLERRFDGFDDLIRGVVDQNISVMSALVEETAEYPRNNLGDFLAYDCRKPMAYKVAGLVEPLMALVMSLAGVDLDNLEDVIDSEVEKTPFAEHHTRLFKVATGWLGWAPEDAWNATPGEIKAAYEGRLDMLKAIFGGGEEKSPAITEDAFAAFMRARAK
ncbi:hypothetical protein AMST5_01443 [freshwater sediment metagenome]|uniref:Tail assembly chaperone n=1 Tax=freshwater sediment metagenome TaxID=556182 RepID=A0AA48M1K2_9ZZZZ